MAYLANSSRVHTLYINGVDRTDNFISFQCADSTANRTGLISTKGNITLGLKPNGLDISTYDRLLFKRGHVVLLDMKTPSGSIYRHPRGYLFVLSTNYSPDASTVNIEVGCRIALAELTENIDELLPFCPFTLPEEAESFSNISAALTISGEVVYQNKQGTLVKRNFFPTNLNYGYNIQGEWLSVLGLTALDVAPLSGNAPLPDAVILTYNLPGSSSSSYGSITTDTTISRYYIQFPMKTYKRTLRWGFGFSDIESTTTTPQYPSLTTDCGNTPDAPGPTDGIEPCTEGFELVDSTEYLSVTNTSEQITYNQGPAGQVSRVVQTVSGPALEVNSQFFTDLYGYCVQSYSNRCSNFCQPKGENTVIQAKTITENFYDTDGTLVLETRSSFVHLAAAAIPTDWRSTFTDDETGETIEQWNGTAIELLLLSDTLYLDSIVFTEYDYFSDGGTIQKTTTYTSLASRNIGISAPSMLDARQGIKTSQTRISRTLSANPALPDRTNNTTSSTSDSIEVTSSFPVFKDAYISPPAVAGPYYAKENFPIDLLTLPGYTYSQLFALMQLYSEKYGFYLINWLKGEALGLRVSEVLNEKFSTSWYPGQPFSYYDSDSGEVLILAADAASWVVAEEGSVVTFQGVWLGVSNGNVTLPENIVGGDPVGDPPSTPVVGTITSQTSLDTGDNAVLITVSIDHYIESTVTFGGKDGSGFIDVWPRTVGGNEVAANQTITCYVTAQLVENGSLLTVEGAGGLPLSYNNILLTQTATVVDADLFS